MRRKQFTRSQAAKELRDAYEEGRLWGLNHGLDDSVPFKMTWDWWDEEVKDAWHRGMRDGREQRQRELTAVAAGETPIPKVVLDPGYLYGGIS